MTPLRQNAIRFYCWRRLRSDPTLTKAELAEELGLSVTTLHECGVRTPRARNYPAPHPCRIPVDTLMQTSGYARTHMLVTYSMPSAYA